MRCRCKGESKVYDSRPHEKNTVLRRRECLKCGKRWRTIEQRVSEIEKKPRVIEEEEI